MKFLSLKSEAFGLDISDLSLKIINLKKEGSSFNLASFGEEKVPKGVIKGGEVKDKEKLTKIIKRALTKIKGEKIKTKYVVASLPEEKSFLEVIQMPKIPKEDLMSAVIYESENYIPLPIEEVYLDSQIVEPLVNNLDHYDVLIAAIPKKTVDPYLSCLKEAGLTPKALEIESLAIARSLIKNEVVSFPILLLDLGATKTSFIIFSGRSLRFTASIPVSSQKFTETIANVLKIDFKKAEDLKIKYGLIEDKKVFECLIPALTDLSEQIKKYIDYYQSHNSHEHLLPEEKEVKEVFLSGGGANLKGLTSFLSFKLKIPVKLGNPWVNILPEPLKEIPKISFEESLKYTTALGLALRGIKEK